MNRVFLACFLLVTSLAAGAESLSAQHGWIRAAPPGATMLAGYVQVSNTGDAELRIVEARSSGFDAVEIHRTIEEDGVARMRPVSFVAIPPGQSVAFEPGGLHLMLMRPRKKLVLGDNVVVELITAAGHELPTVFKVSGMPVGDGHDHSQHGDHRH